MDGLILLRSTNRAATSRLFACAAECRAVRLHYLPIVDRPVHRYTPGAFPGGTCTGCGIFTSVRGTAPNRIFNIEWRTVSTPPSTTTPTANFEVSLYESDPNLKFEVIYRQRSAGLAALHRCGVGGVQGNTGAGFFTQDFCNLRVTRRQQRLTTYEIPPCASPSPTPTATATATPTATATVTATPTPRPTPTPRFAPTPRPRPTPPPRP